MDYFSISGKIAMVTGGGSGLGRSAVLAYAEAGCKVALLGRRASKLEDVASEVKAMGGQALPVTCDITVEEQVNAAVLKIVEHWGRIDILLNNAGISVPIMPETPMEVWDETINTNLRSQWLTIRAVVPHFINQGGGKIVNIASVNAIKTQKHLPLHPYYASKSGIVGLTRGVASFYGKDKIYCNCIGPGLFMTDMTGDWTEDMLKAYNERCPLERPGGETELNGPILFLSSPASDYVTGQFLVVDGGCTVT